jgi:hypothetical protein
MGVLVSGMMTASGVDSDAALGAVLGERAHPITTQFKPGVWESIRSFSTLPIAQSQ